MWYILVWQVAGWVWSLAISSCLNKDASRRMIVSAVAVHNDAWCSSTETHGCGDRMPPARQRCASTPSLYVSPSLLGKWSRVALSTVRYSLLLSCPISTQLTASSGKLTTSLIQTTAEHRSWHKLPESIHLQCTCHTLNTPSMMYSWDGHSKPSPHGLNMTDSWQSICNLVPWARRWWIKQNSTRDVFRTFISTRIS